MVTGGCRDARLMVSTEGMSPRCDPARHSRVFYRVLSEGAVSNAMQQQQCGMQIIVFVFFVFVSIDWVCKSSLDKL